MCAQCHCSLTISSKLLHDSRSRYLITHSNTRTHLLEIIPQNDVPTLFTRQHTNSETLRAAFLYCTCVSNEVQSLMYVIGLPVQRFIESASMIGVSGHVIHFRHSLYVYYLSLLVYQMVRFLLKLDVIGTFLDW